MQFCDLISGYKTLYKLDISTLSVEFLVRLTKKTGRLIFLEKNQNFAPTFQRIAECLVGVCWEQPPPFHLLQESINVQIKLFIKVARGAGGSAYCDQQWGRVSLDVKSSNCQITKLRQNAFEKSTQKLPLKLGCTIGPSRLYSLKYRTGGCLERV